MFIAAFVKKGASSERPARTFGSSSDMRPNADENSGWFW